MLCGVSGTVTARGAPGRAAVGGGGSELGSLPDDGIDPGGRELGGRGGELVARGGAPCRGTFVLGEGTRLLTSDLLTSALAMAAGSEALVVGLG